jgi:hypothetical protein
LRNEEVPVELDETEVHFIPSGCYLVSYYDGGWVSFPLFILHPRMHLSKSGAGRERLSSPLPLLLHEVAFVRLFSSAEAPDAAVV